MGWGGVRSEGRGGGGGKRCEKAAGCRVNGGGGEGAGWVRDSIG